MARRRNRFRGEHQHWSLERREMPSQGGLPIAAEVGTLSVQGGPDARHGPDGHAGDFFHRNGLDGLEMHKSFSNQMTYRLNVSRTMAHRIFEAFQVFSQAFTSSTAVLPGGAGGQPQGGSGGPGSGPSGGQGTSGTGNAGGSQTPGPPPSVPVPNLQLGNPAFPPTLPNLVQQLEHFVVLALGTREVTSSQAQISDRRGLRVSPLAPDGLIPYALARIQQLNDELAPLPPINGSTNSPQAKAAQDALSRAYNDILNAVAEFSLHPNLFTSPVTFYINRKAKFTTTFDATPAKAAPGYFVRGPGGALLPGAVLHPHTTDP